MKKILIGLCCLGLLLGGFVAYSKYRIKPVNQIIATDILISTEWSEFSPETPLQVNRQTQRIVLLINGYKYNSSDRPWQIKLSDGTIVKPEIQIFDEYGNAYDLHDNERTGDAVGFGLKPNSERFTTFPKDRDYTKVRIRSDKPFHCSKIVWRNKDMK